MSQSPTSQSILEELLGKLGFEATVEFDEAAQLLEIDTEDHAILIGKRGENLRALQYIFNILRRHQIPDSDFVAIDVAGYKQERIEKVQKIAEESALEVIQSGQEKTLPSMNSFERRQVHMVLADNPDVVTESIGQEPHRTIVIKKRD